MWITADLHDLVFDFPCSFLAMSRPDFELSHFWRWSNYRDYVQCIGTFTITMVMVTALLMPFSLYVELLGFCALITEAMLGAPQFYHNFKSKSTAGMRYGLVWILSLFTSLAWMHVVTAVRLVPSCQVVLYFQKHFVSMFFFYFFVQSLAQIFLSGLVLKFSIEAVWEKPWPGKDLIFDQSVQCSWWVLDGRRDLSHTFLPFTRCLVLVFVCSDVSPGSVFFLRSTVRIAFVLYCLVVLSSVKMVCCWLSGDIFKTGYFLVKNTPPQFYICGALQVVIDISILAQVFLYKTAPSPKWMP